ncbi:unnamed protein product [Hapterophycus canaliculatus]
MLALPRHQLFRLFRDWAAGRVGSGAAAGETNERIACMFRGVGEITWKEIVSTSGGTIVRTHMAAAGVCSSGAGLEVVPFSYPVPALGRLEVWVRDVDRQLMSAIAQDVEFSVDVLREDSKAGGGLGRPALLHIGRAANGNAGLQSRSGTEPAAKQYTVGGNSPAAMAGKGSGSEGFAAGSRSEPGRGEDQASTIRRPSVQGQLLARSVHWTAAVETALCSDASLRPLLPPRDASGGRGHESMAAVQKPGRELQQILALVAQNVNGWVEELCQPGGLTAYSSLTNTALVTQALQQRDVVEQLMKATLRSASAPFTSPPTTLEGCQTGLTSTAGSEAATLNIESGEERLDGTAESSEFSPFLWTCHLRHYYTSPSETKAEGEGEQEGHNGHPSDKGSKWTEYGNGEGHPDPEDSAPPLPLIRVGLGPWNVPYGFEYAGTWEKLWLTPLSERCLLHAIHSAKGRYGGLLVSTSGSDSHRRQLEETSGLSVAWPSTGGDISGVAQDVAIAFGRPFRKLHSGCVTSPQQAISSVIASTLMAGGVTVFAGLDELPKVSLAVLAESLRAVILCLHAGQEKVLVNGEEVPLSTKPHLLPNYDPVLHQWRLLPWDRQTEGPGNRDNSNGGGGGGPFLGFFATLAKRGEVPQIPLSVRFSFRPVLTALPNTPLLLEAMLLSNGFLGARLLVRGLVQGLRELRGVTGSDRACTSHSDFFLSESHTTRAGVPSITGAVPSPAAAAESSGSGSIDSGARNSSKLLSTADAATLLHTVAVKAVRRAAGLLAPETARELRVARRKLGLASLTSSERKEKTEHLSRAVEARVLIAGFVMALLLEETGGDVRALKSQKTKKTPPSSSGGSRAASSAAAAPKGGNGAAKGSSTPKDAGQLDIDSRRATMVSIFQQTEVFRTILKPLEEMTATGRTLAQPSVKLRTTELAESGTVYRSRDMAEVKSFAKRALIVTGISPTRDQIDAAAEVWQALWSCSRPAVIVTGAAGVGKSSVLLAMPKMAEHVDITNRKLNRMLKKNAAAEKKKEDKVAADGAQEKEQKKMDSSAQHPSASPLDPAGAVFEPPANTRGAAPYRRIVNRQVPFVAYVSATASFRKTASHTSGDGGTVASGASGSSKGTKATTISDASNVSGGSSDGGASVFSQRSAATKSSSASRSSKGSAGQILVGKSGGVGIPRATIEGSAFVIPAQEVEVIYTGGCSAEHLIGSTDDKGSWLDGLLLRRLRVLAEGVRSGGTAGIARSRHRACGVGTGDICIPPAGKATSGFSHGCKSRLLVLDGPVSRLLEGILAGDHCSGPPVTEQEEYGHNARCLLLPDGEALALDAWGHVAVETGDIRHLSPSTITGVAIVHLRADGPALIKGMREAWLKKLSRRRFQHPATSGGAFRPVLLAAVSEFFRQEGLAEGGCCLEGTGNAQKAATVEPATPASICASRMRNTLMLLEGLLDVLIQTDEHAVLWEPEVGSERDGINRGTWGAAHKSLSKSWQKVALGVQASGGFHHSANAQGSTKGASAIIPPGAMVQDQSGAVFGARGTTRETGMDENAGEGESGAWGVVGAPAPVATVIAQQNDLTPAEIQEIEKRLRLRALLLCVYASLWGMGGHLVGEASRVMCSAFIRQSSPFELREHIRESNLFNFVVDINRSKLVPIGEDASACPGALPRGMWTLDRHWATQASELSCPLPPSLVIPSLRLSSVATAAYTLLGMDNARVLVEGPSGAGKTALLSHLLKVVGKGIPDIATEQQASDGMGGKPYPTGSLPEYRATETSALPGSTGQVKPEATLGNGIEMGRSTGVGVGLDGMGSEDRIGKRIHALDCARRQMAAAGAKAAAACFEDTDATESGASRLASRGRCGT